MKRTEEEEKEKKKPNKNIKHMRNYRLAELVLWLLFCLLGNV